VYQTLVIISLLCFVSAPLMAADPEPATATQPADASSETEKSQVKSDGLHPRAKVSTTLGDFVLELDGVNTPLTVLNFLTYVESNFYEGTVFHRVIPTFMIQGGGFDKDLNRKTEGLEDPVRNESKSAMSNKRGTISMARTGNPHSATSQFFINVVDNPRLDAQEGGRWGYTVFGKVVEGMDVVDKIKDTELFTHPNDPGRGREPNVNPKEPVVIESVEIIGGLDREKLEQRGEARQDKAAKAADRKEEEERAKLKAHAEKLEQELGKEAKTTESGLMYIMIEEGDGESPEPTDRVKVHYTGWLLDGTKFDSSHDRGQPVTFPLNGVIKGWTEGVGLMKVGGKARLIIPYAMAYGERGRPPRIPPRSPLDFEVELLAIE